MDLNSFNLPFQNDFLGDKFARGGTASFQENSIKIAKLVEVWNRINHGVVLAVITNIHIHKWTPVETNRHADK